MRTLIAASLDTTTNFLTFLLYAFAKNPKIQEQARKEVTALLAGKDVNGLTYSDLDQMKFIHCCIKETLRMYPPFPQMARLLDSPVEIDGKWLPSGFIIRIEIFLLHHNPEIWSNPFNFDPSRFLPENTAKRDPYAFLPFGAGPKQCVAPNFAIAKAKILLAKLLHEFDISLHQPYELRYDFCMTMAAPNNIPFQFTKRSQ